MNVDLQRIKDASAGLFYLSESDYPFEVVSLEAAINLEDALHILLEKRNESPIKIESLEQFLSNMTTHHSSASPEQQHTAHRFINLQQVLQEELQDVAVYLLGEVEIDAFILGRAGDRSYAGLRTKVIQT
jgi:hypothetical protein